MSWGRSNAQTKKDRPAETGRSKVNMPKTYSKYYIEFQEVLQCKGGVFMNKIQGWEDIEPMRPGAGNRLPAGGYVCVIKGAKDQVSKRGNKILSLALDIVGGVYDGYFAQKFTARQRYAEGAAWPCVHNQAYEKGMSANFFKGIIEAVKASNEGYCWRWQESTLVGKLVGVIFRDEEYMADDGTVRMVAKPYSFVAVSELDSVPVPEPRRLQGFGPDVSPDSEIPY